MNGIDLRAGIRCRIIRNQDLIFVWSDIHGSARLPRRRNQMEYMSLLLL
jgi:hypothetical protein